MGLSLSAEQKKLTQLFDKTNTYIVPSYQRPYSWGEKECSELWEDLKFRFYDDSSDEYFLGNIVLAKSNQNDVIEVIDGQQRLITLTILLKVLFLFDKNNDYLEEAIWNKDRRDKTQKTARLTTRVYEDNDNKNFKEVLDYTEEQIKKIDIRIANQFEENMKLFYDKLTDITEINPDNIPSFGDFLLEKVYILPIQSVDAEEEKAREKALVIFETINNRGLDLSDADIFKAQLYNSALNQEKSEDFIERWTRLDKLAKYNDYTLVDVFRIYTHILRGKNKETGNEIGLRAFFSQDSSKEDTTKKEEKDKLNYIPLRKQNYIDVLKDLNKILTIIDTFNQCIKNEYKENNPYSKYSKWFQVIDEYTNNNPKFVIFVYLFYNSHIDKDNCLILKEREENELLLLSQNIIRYSYPHTSAMKTKFEIFKIIEKIANHEEYSFIGKIEKLQKENFISFRAKDGRKKGFILLAIYLDKKQKIISPYYFHTIITSTNRKNLNESWKEQKYDKYSNSIGNILLTDIKRKTQALNQRVEAYKKSNIIDLQNLSTKLKNFNYKDFIEREDILSNRLVEFFSSDKLW